MLRHYTFVDYATQAYMTLVGALILFFHNATVPHWPWLLASEAAGIVLVHLLIQFQGSRRLGSLLNFLRHFYPVLLYAWLFAQTGWLNRMFVDHYLDPSIIRWEQALFGCQPSVLFMQKLPDLALSEILYASYFSYYLMIGGIGLALYLRNRQQFFHYISVISFVFYVCYLIYIALPIVGPRVFFHDVPDYSLPRACQQLAPIAFYPDTVKAGPFYHIVSFIYRVIEAPGAALPSSHVAIAMCTVFFSFLYLPRIRYAHLGVAILLCVATVYCRYHYGLDVLTGLLTAAILVPIANWLYFRLRPPQQEGLKTAEAEVQRL